MESSEPVDLAPRAEVLPRPPAAVTSIPPWRQQIEAATRLAVGLGTAMLGVDGRDDSAVQSASDVAVAVVFEGERRALDGAERLIDAGSALARLGARLPVTRALVLRTKQSLEPIRVRGMTERTHAVQAAQANVPRYADRVVRVALDVVSLNNILEHVDVERILERVDVQRIIDRVDVEGIIERVDVQGIIDRVDVQALIESVDLDQVVASTDIGSLIAQSTGGMASGAVDLVRRQGVGLDGFVARWGVRARPRRLRDAPPGPPLLVETPTTSEPESTPEPEPESPPESTLEPT